MALESRSFDNDASEADGARSSAQLHETGSLIPVACRAKRRRRRHYRQAHLATERVRAARRVRLPAGVLRRRGDDHLIIGSPLP